VSAGAEEAGLEETATELDVAAELVSLLAGTGDDSETTVEDEAGREEEVAAPAELVSII